MAFENGSHITLRSGSSAFNIYIALIPCANGFNVVKVKTCLKMVDYRSGIGKIVARSLVNVLVVRISRVVATSLS